MVGSTGCRTSVLAARAANASAQVHKALDLICIGGYRHEVMMHSLTARFGPAPILGIHVLALIGVLFWASTIIQALIAGLPDGWAVIPLGVVLGGAHVAISYFTTHHNRRAFAAIWFVFFADGLLAIFVNPLATILVLFTVVLLILAHTSTAKEWFQSSQQRSA